VIHILKTYSPKDIDVSQYFSMIVYGVPKIGKTTFSSTAKKCLIINTERGMGSIRNSNVDIVDCYTLKDLQDIVNELKTDTKYDVIVIDTLTELTNLFQNELKGMATVLTQQQWQIISSKLQQMIIAFRALNKNKIYLCQQEVDGVTQKIQPMLQPNKFKYYVQAQVDIIARMGLGKDEASGQEVRYLTATPTDSAIAGDRFNVLPKAIPPDFEVIKKLISQSKEKTNVNRSPANSTSTPPAGSSTGNTKSNESSTQ